MFHNPVSYSEGDPLDDLDEFNIKFTIGEEFCSNVGPERKYCNGHLEPNTYGVMARIFTENGFRDTEPVIIEIKPKTLKFLSPTFASLGAILVVLIISLIALLLCVICKRRDKRRKKTKKLKQAAEADENLLSFTSYCVIDRNPLPRKNYDE